MVARGRADAVTVLTLFLVLRYALPSNLTIGAMGGAGSPAAVFAIGCLVWWGYYHLQRPPLTPVGTHPVRAAALVLWFAFLASYIAAMTRPLDVPEKSVADLGLVALISWLGALLLAHDGIPSWERAITLIRRLVAGAAAVALLGILQTFTKQVYVDRISIPGLTTNTSLGALSERGGFDRAAGTALHAIELGAVLTMVLPFAIALAFTDTGRSFVRRWFPAAAIALSATLTVSRSAIVGATLGVGVLALGMAPATRRIVIGAGAAFAAFVFVTIPSLLGTILGLFTTAGSDSSVQSRTGSYALALQFIRRAPLFGRGPATFLPSYRILDNQYLLLSIEVGLVGLAAVLALVLAGIFTAKKARDSSIDPRQRLLCQACMASLVAGGVELALFDGFSFPMFSGLLFLVVGISGALWRLERLERPATARVVAKVIADGRETARPSDGT